MTIDTKLESLLAFNDARTAFPGKKRVCLQTLHRWRLHGVRGVKLETIMIGGMRFTSHQAITRFIEKQNITEQPAVTITPKQRASQSAAARQSLAAAGV